MRRGRGRGLGRGPVTQPQPVDATQLAPVDENNNTSVEKLSTAMADVQVNKPTIPVRGGLRARGRGLLGNRASSKPVTQTAPDSEIQQTTITSVVPTTSVAPPRGGLSRRGRGGLGRGALARVPTPVTPVKQSEPTTSPTAPLPTEATSKTSSSTTEVRTAPNPFSDTKPAQTCSASVMSEGTPSQTTEKSKVVDDILPDDSASQIGTKNRKTDVSSTDEMKRRTGGASTTTEQRESSVKSNVTDEPNCAKVNIYGKAGTTCTLATNFVRVIPMDKTGSARVYQYSVKFNPPVDSERLCKILLWQHEDKFPKTIGRVFDGRGILYTSKPVHDSDDQQEFYLTSKSRENNEYKIRVKLAKLIPVDSSKMVPVYNTIIHRIQKEMGLVPMRDSYYAMHREKKIPCHGISVWPGYTATVQEQVSGLMLCVDLSFKVLRNQNVHSIFNEIRKEKGDVKTNCMRALVGSQIVTRYNNKNYRIDDIDWEAKPTDTFMKNGKEISFIEYFKEQYDLTIKDKKQPMLINRPKKKAQRLKRAEDGQDQLIYLVPELCNATGLTDKMRCDFKVMQELAKTTRVKPDVRNQELQGFIDDIHKVQSGVLEFEKWGMKIDKHPATLQGRNIHKETLVLGGGMKKPVNAQADFGAIVTKSAMIDPIKLHDWVVFHESKDKKKIDSFIDCYTKTCRVLAQSVSKPTVIEVKGKNAEQIRHMDEYLKAHPTTQLVVNMMSTKREDKYNAFKTLCCVQNPVPSQCIVSRTLPNDPKEGKFSSVTQKIALQINAKLGGSLWAVQIPIDGMMLVGIDVWHGATKSSKRASVVSLVASYDKSYTKWYSRATFHDEKNEEISKKLHGIFMDALKNYRYYNNKLPNSIIIYRDGVSDGALREFRETELLAFQKGAEEFKDGYKPKIGVIIVSKRVNTRMYSLQGKKLDNPMPGTIMDTKVTKPYYQDFYLVSQYVRQGTVTPSHFICLENGDLPPDHLQKLSYKLTHMYYNWPGTVRVPAPCQYAHKLAALVGENIQTEPDQKLADKLFYL